MWPLLTCCTRSLVRTPKSDITAWSYASLVLGSLAQWVSDARTAERLSDKRWENSLANCSIASKDSPVDA